MSHHESTTPVKTDWITPKYIIDALGPFALDPCAGMDMPWQTAARMLTEEDDGLTTPWGTPHIVFMNPPFGPANVEAWMARWWEQGTPDMILVVPARVETAWFHRWVFQMADLILFPLGRINYCLPTGEKVTGAGFPSCIVGYGKIARRRIRDALAGDALRGHVVQP